MGFPTVYYTVNGETITREKITPSIPKKAVITPSGVTFTLTAPGAIGIEGTNFPINSRTVDDKACSLIYIQGIIKPVHFTFIHRDFESRSQSKSKPSDSGNEKVEGTPTCSSKSN